MNSGLIIGEVGGGVGGETAPTQKAQPQLESIMGSPEDKQYPGLGCLAVEYTTVFDRFNTGVEDNSSSSSSSSSFPESWIIYRDEVKKENEKEKNYISVNSKFLTNRELIR